MNFSEHQRYKYVFITHNHADHYNLFEKIKRERLTTVGEAYVGCKATDYTRTMQKWLNDHFSAPKVHYSPGLNTIPPVNIKVVSINTDSFNHGCSNSNGMALRLEYGKFSLFLPGDLEDTSDNENGLLINGMSEILKNVSDRGGIYNPQCTGCLTMEHGQKQTSFSVYKRFSRSMSSQVANSLQEDTDIRDLISTML